jgi:hypothetical protein
MYDIPKSKFSKRENIEACSACVVSASGWCARYHLTWTELQRTVIGIIGLYAAVVLRADSVVGWDALVLEVVVAEETLPATHQG